MDICPQNFMSKNQLIKILNTAIDDADITLIDEIIILIKNQIKKEKGE